MQGGIQASCAGADNDDVIKICVAGLDCVGQGGDVFNHFVSLGHGVFDDGRPSQIADNKKPRDVALIVFLEIGAFVLTTAGVKDRYDLFFDLCANVQENLH